MIATAPSKVTFSHDDILAEAATRELARRRFLPYAQYVMPDFEAHPHHVLIADALERVALYILSGGQPEVVEEIDEGRSIKIKTIGRLMIFMPPRHGKTTEAHQVFPSWMVGKMPDIRIITTAYGAGLAEKNSLKIREYVTSREFKNIFWGIDPERPTIELSEDSQAKSEWDLARPNKGGVVAAGVGGGITGHGAHLLLIDDPFKGRKDAESEIYREDVMDWYRSSAHNRLEKGGAIVITHTRWHPEDLAGELIKEMLSGPMADQWEIIFLPAIALDKEDYPKNIQEQKDWMLRGTYVPMEDPLGREPGEVLWPDKFSKEKLLAEQATEQEYDFASVYQQMPTSKGSNVFIEKDFGTIEKAEVPEGLRWMGYIDLALGEGKTSCFNAVARVAIHPERGWTMARDMLRIRDLTQFLASLKITMLLESEKNTLWGFEKVAFQSLVLKDFLKDTQLANVAMIPVPPVGSKEDRALAVQTRGRQGMYKLVRGEWNQPCIREAVAFPKGKYKDQVDTLSGGQYMIAKYGAGKRKARSYQR